MRYAIVIEKADGNYSAYVPDLPGCVATGETPADVEQAIREAIEIHLEGMREEGLTIAAPTSRGEYVEITPSPTLSAKQSYSSDARPLPARRRIVRCEPATSARWCF